MSGTTPESGDSQELSRSDKFPTLQLSVLAICRIAEPLALTSVLPYAFDLMKHLLGDNAEKAPFYAGLFIAAFSLTESLAGIFWGTLSDRVGRKPVLVFGCAGTLVSMLVMGFSKNIGMAITGRALGGALNGNVGVVQTMVGELVTNPKHEPRAYAIMPFFWSIGVTIGPVIGGFFARPAEGFPSVFGDWPLFIRFPYLLPNLVCALLLLITIVVAATSLDETHPEMKHRRGKRYYLHPADDPEGETHLIAASIPDNGNSYGTVSNPTAINLATSSSRRLPFNVWMIILAICLLSAHTMTYIQLLPIFLQSPKDETVPQYHLGGVGGLGMSLKTIGFIMGVNGLVGLGIQAFIFPLVTEFLGLEITFLLTTSLHPLSYFSLPYLAFLPHGVWCYSGIYIWMTIRNCFSMIAYPLGLIFLKRATPDPLMLGRVNGLAQSSGAACRTIGPPVAGLLQNIGDKHHLSALAWWGSGIVALVGAVQCWSINRPTG